MVTIELLVIWIFWVNKSSENFRRLQSAFEIFGIPRAAIPEAEFHDSSLADVFSFGRPPTAINIMTAIMGLEFDEAYKRALTINIEKDFMQKYNSFFNRNVA